MLLSAKLDISEVSEKSELCGQDYDLDVDTNPIYELRTYNSSMTLRQY